MNKLSWLLACIAIATAAFVLLLASPGARAWQSGDAYGGSGDWTISNPTVLADEAVAVSGNVAVKSGGSLTMYQAGISMSLSSDGGYSINVESGGSLYVYDSTLTSNNGAYHYKFTVYGNLDINQSYVSETWGDTSGASWAGGIQIYNSGAQVRNSWIYNGRTGGIYIYNVAATVTGCEIYNNGAGGASTTYCYGIYMANDGTGTTTATRVDGNRIHDNTYVSGVTRYGIGVYSQFQGSGDQITNNVIWNNGHANNANSQGTQLRLQYSNATVTDDFLGNGSYQLYVLGSTPPQFKNLNISSYAYSSYTTYGVYGDNSTLNFKTCSWYMYYGMGTIYGVRATGPSVNSTSQLDFTDCSFNYSMSGTYARYCIYATTRTPINVTGTVFTTVYGTTVQMIYGSSYCPINITGSAFNMTLNTASPSFVYVSTWSNVNIKTSTFEATGSWQGSNFFYGTSYCNWSVTECRVDIWLVQPTSSYTFYGFQVRTYAASWYSKLTYNFTVLNLSTTASPTFYHIYNYNSIAGGFGALALDNCTVNLVWPATCTTSGGTLYGIYSYYTPTFLNFTKICSLNETLRGSNNGIYAYYQSLDIDNSTVVFTKIHGSGGYGIYHYGDSSRSFFLNITNSRVIINYSIPGNLYSTPNVYVYNYYSSLNIIKSRVEIIGGYYTQFYNYAYGGTKDAYIIDSTILIRPTSDAKYYQYQYAYLYLYYFMNIYMERTNINLTAATYCYMYVYGQSGQNNLLNVNNCTFDINNYIPGYYQYSYAYLYNYYFKNMLIENNVYNIDFGYYLYNLFGYSQNCTVRLCKYNFRQYAYGYPSLSGYMFYFPGSYSTDPTYYDLMENCTVDYQSFGASATGPYMYYIYNNKVDVRNVDIKVRNWNGTVPVMVAYPYYGGILNMTNVTFDAEFGTDSPGGGMPGFNLAYIYNSGSSYPPSTFNLTESKWSIVLARDTFLHNGFYIYGTNDQVNIINSVVKWNITSPGATLRVFRFYDDPAGPGKLNVLNLTGSKITVDVNGPDAQVFILKMGAGTSIGRTVVRGSAISANYFMESSLPVNLVEVVGVNGFTLSDLTLNMNAPAGSNMEMNGVRLQASEATVTNMYIKGNGQGRMTGIMCDLTARGLITNVTIENCRYGITSIFYSEPTIKGVTIIGGEVGIYVNASGNGTLTGENSIGSPVTISLYDESWLNIIDTVLPPGATRHIELDTRSTAWCLNASFTENKVVFKDQNSTLIVNQWLRISVYWKSAAGVETARPVAGASLVLNNAQGREFLRTATDAEGGISWFTATEYVRVAAGKTVLSPYKVELDYNGFTGSDSISLSGTTDARLFLVDDSLPVLAITSPEDGRIQNFRDVEMSGTAEDLGSGLDRLEVSFDGATWHDVDVAAAWSALLVIPEGDYTLTVRLSDVAGNSVEDRVAVHIDLTPPVITVSSPADRSLGNRISVELAGTVEKGSALTINHRLADVLEDGSFTFGVKLVEGSNEFLLFATDRAGNTNSLRWTLHLDITPPPLSLSSPADGLLTNRSEVQVAGSTEPGATVTLNGAPVEVGPDGMFSAAFTLRPGLNTLTVVATDAAGNRASQLRTVLLDNEIALSVSFPTDNLATNQVTILVRGQTGTDVQLRLNEALVAVDADGNFSVTITLEEGQNELVFRAEDLAGNWMFLTRRVVLDISSPSLELLSPQDGTLLRSREVAVSGVCEPGITLTVNGEAVPTETGSFSKTLTLPEGKSLITLEGRDAAGNSVSAQVSVMVDLTAPSLEVVEPATGFRTRDYAVVVVGITEPGASVSVNGRSVMVDPFGKFTTSITLKRGKNDIKVVASDGAGNSDQKTVSVTGTTAPGAASDNNWWWAVAGLVVALGIMLPLSALLITVAMKGGKPKEGSK